MTDRKTFIKNSLYATIGTSAIYGSIRNESLEIFDQKDMVNVKTFGDKGDGITDDRQAIQQAMDSLKDRGGSIYIPPGIYRLSMDPKTQAGIRFYSNTSILGAGRGNTILRWLDDVPTTENHYLMAGDGGYVENVTITGFEIDGNKAARGDTLWHSGGEGIEIDGSNIIIYDMYIHDVLGEGIDCDKTESMLIANVIVENTGGNGLHCSDPAVRNVLISNTITRNCAHGRQAMGNLRYGGLVLRGSGIYVNNHRSVDDAQVANLEGQGLGEDNEIHLTQVTGISSRSTAEGFRIGMEGRVSLTCCRIELPNSEHRGFYTDNFTGELSLKECYSLHGSGYPFHLKMKGLLRLNGCTSKVHDETSNSDGFYIDVDGRACIRDCEASSRQKNHTGFAVINASGGLNMNGCRAVNDRNRDGHCLYVARFENSRINLAPMISISGGSFKKSGSGGSAVRIEAAPGSVIQIRDLEQCHGGHESLVVGLDESNTQQELMIIGNRLSDNQICLKVFRSVTKGLITANYGNGDIKLYSKKLKVIGNRLGCKEEQE